MKWEKKDIDPQRVRDMAATYGCDLLTASILSRRGINSGEDAKFYLEDDSRHLHNPFLLPAMEDAVERILAAKEEGEKVLVFGDRDVDGITSTTILVQALRGMGIDVSWQVPLGDESYGLSIEAVERFAKEFGSLIITVDCGISNLQEIAHAQELGVQTIVVDHHHPGQELPPAFAIVNPKIPDCGYPFADLAGCAVAWKLTQALRWAQNTQLFNQNICLLNTRPINDAWLIEMVKLRNMVVQEVLIETVVPGMVSIAQTRLPDFLQGQQIMVWDANVQQKGLNRIFGGTVEFAMLDISGEIGKEIPSVAGKSLLRIKELSRIARYSDAPLSELDVFLNLFTSFIHRREKILGDCEDENIQLAALGTIADLMPLTNENRIIVRQGLAAMNKKPRGGLSELLFKLNIAGKVLTTTDISWQLSPAINSTGRMGQAEMAVRLLTEEDARRREQLAGEIIAMNEERKKIGADSWTLVEPRAKESLETYHGKLVLAWGDDIHRGVTGIMANRLVSVFKVPAIVVSFINEHEATGSLRSTRGYDLRGILEQCADLFIDHGGHSYAAGFSMRRENWNAFIQRLGQAAHTVELGDSQNEEILSVDAELPAAMMNAELLSVLDRFEPFGEGNPPLLFLGRKLKVNDIQLMGRNEVRHVKLSLDAGAFKWPAIYWQAGDKVKSEFDMGDMVDIVFRAGRNWFNGNETPQLTIQDLKRT